MQKVHASQNIVLYFKGVTVNTKNYSQWSRSPHLRDKQCKQFSTPQKEKPTRKKKRKEIARSSVGRSSDKSHNTNTNVSQKIILSFQGSYNHLRRLQNPSLHLRELQSADSFSTSQKITISKAFPTSADHDRSTLVKEKTIRKGKRKRGGRGKKGRIGIMEKAGLKSVPSEAYRPL